MKEIYVFGHRNPDTDSVSAAISYAHLKKAKGFNAVPKILGEINPESAFVLDYFKVEKPSFLNDVKVRIKDVGYIKNAYVNEFDSIDKAFALMAELNITAVPVVNEMRKIVGYLTLKDVAKYLVKTQRHVLDTNLGNVKNSLGAELLTFFDRNVKGETIVAGLDVDSFFEVVDLNPDKVLIVGHRRKILEKAIENKVNLIILTGNKELDSDLLKLAERNKVNIVKTNLTTVNVANKVVLTNYVNTMDINKNPIVVKRSDYYTDFKELVRKETHTNYPVVNKKDECVGLIKSVSTNIYEKQKVILVDHNTSSQSAVGLEEASIIEIVDHHNLGALNTSDPISFRSVPVGCTCTIIYQMYNEANVEIPKDIAGLMLAAILSDTLILTSPTTTDDDRVVVEKLAELAGVNYQEFGKEMFNAACSIEGLSALDLVEMDYKTYALDNIKIDLSQITTMDYEKLAKKKDDIIKILERNAELGCTVAAFYATNIVTNGSYIFYNEKAKDIIKEAYGLEEVYQGVFVKGLVSRKKQMLPNLLEILK